MPPRKRKMQPQSPPGDPFLRSINIRYDADDANRIAHFRHSNSHLAHLRE